ncbi:peptidase domain-containing ABC transporter [Pseudomonas sp. nanlin1]|uniref:peptidase domain-containing ABC transporter n=1 Tax=Pseudomonas sp. nanlin1 TaxID=3040605 RepID=UPI00388D8EEA
MSYLDSLAFRIGRRLPLILQTEATECGLACLAMISCYHGYHVSLMDLRRQFSVSLKGMNLKQLITTAKILKLGTRSVRLELEDIGKLSLPCILHWNFNHFVVLKAIQGEYVVLHDPAKGNCKLSLSEVSLSFTGIAVELWTDNGFEKKKAKSEIKIADIVGRVHGLYRSLTQVLILALVLETMSLIGPFFLQWIFDNVLITQDRDLLHMLIIGFSILLVMQQAVSFTLALVMIHMTTLLSVQWRANVFTHLLRLPVQYFEKRHLGDIVSRFGAIGEIQKTLTAAFFSTLLDGLMTIATLILMFAYSPPLSLVSVAAIVAYAAFRWAWYLPLRRASEEQITHTARQESHFFETVRGIRTIKLFQRDAERRSVWLALLVQQINAGLRTHKLQLTYTQLNSLIFGAESIIAVGFGASMVMNSEFTVGVLMAFIAYKTQFMSRVSSLIDSIFALNMLRLQAERLADIVTSPPEDIKEFEDRDPALFGDIDIKGLKYRYSAHEDYVLKGIDLHIAYGELVAIAGASGSGKSTLIGLLLGILTPTEGKIKIAGEDLRHLNVNKFRSQIGTVMQDDCLFAGSLADNIAFFDTSPDLDWIIECSRKASIHDEIQALPMGYNTLVGDMGTVLSGGQKQRVLLARALYKKPDILILDEATSHLDLACERQVNLALQSLQITRILVAHRPETIATANRVVSLHAGRVVDDRVNMSGCGR